MSTDVDNELIRPDPNFSSKSTLICNKTDKERTNQSIAKRRWGILAKALQV